MCRRYIIRSLCIPRTRARGYSAGRRRGNTEDAQCAEGAVEAKIDEDSQTNADEEAFKLWRCQLEAGTSERVDGQRAKSLGTSKQKITSSNSPKHLLLDFMVLFAGTSKVTSEQFSQQCKKNIPTCGIIPFCFHSLLLQRVCSNIVAKRTSQGGQNCRSYVCAGCVR